MESKALSKCCLKTLFLRNFIKITTKAKIWMMTKEKNLENI